LKARLAVLALFLIHGLVVSTWASRLPLIQTHLGISAGQLGLLLLASAGGAILAMPATAKLMAHWGSKRISVISSLALCAALPMLAMASSSLGLAVALFYYGFTAGVMDVSMNSQAVYLEKRYQKSIMVAFHAFFSIGGLMGAALGSVIASQKIMPLEHFIGSALAYSLVIVIASRFLMTDHSVTHASKKEPLFASFSWPLVGLSIIGFCCFLSEGAIIDWSGIYLYRVLHAGESLAALGYAFFSISMTFGRLIGDGLTDRFGTAGLVVGGCLFAALGVMGVLLSPGVVTALICFVLVGLGFSVIIPLVFSAAGRISGNSNANLTTITLFSYCAFLLGPPAIGFLADQVGLRMALASIVVLTSGAALFAKEGFPDREQADEAALCLETSTKE